MAFKNHYKTLGIPPNATLEAVKKEFRKLALQYHPDVNAGNEFAVLQFRELQEAYETLSHPSKRAKYHNEWKLRFPGSDIHMKWGQTPVTILNDCIKLNKQMASMDIFRMNKEVIYHRIKNILSESNINVLLHHKDEALNQKLILQLLSASSELPYKYTGTIAGQLNLLAGNNETAIKTIRDFVHASKKRNYWEKYYPFLVLLITLIICSMIYSLT
ncbi:J domain-containing protein [Agriterribacter sp.]|uniref:J domain-containing protein n=1 Tax=Agriterribacter sp. TaxID=2821509 RepID=UPI002C4F9721|nr:J domain-containing protein [Agriterribacter sp.]HRP54607.1 J domain-containing protein [Agriterribacter sp.]